MRTPLDHPFQIYDLKGSTRNRHVQSTGKENEVLLDENLVQSLFPLITALHLLISGQRPTYPHFMFENIQNVL
jgi:hypothetical protein